MKILLGVLATIEAFLSVMLIWLALDAIAEGTVVGIVVSGIVAVILGLVWSAIFVVLKDVA